jgi:hypothetical protein
MPRTTRRTARIWYACAAAGAVLVLLSAALAWRGLTTAPAVDLREARATGSAGEPTGGSPVTPSRARPTGAAGATGATGGPALPVTGTVGGKPGPANTGVPAGLGLRVVTGDQVYRTANQVISGLDIHGYVSIRAKNVTLKNSIVRGGAPRCNAAVISIGDGASATITDTEIIPSHPNACLDGISAQHAVLRRLDIHGTVDGIKAYDTVTLLDSYVHDLSYFASDPNQGGGPTHNDDVQTFVGNQHVTLRHNTLTVDRRGNAAYQVTQDLGGVATDLHIEDNWLDGGQCTLNFGHKGGPTPMTGIYVTNNRFGRGSVYACPILLSTQTFLSQNSGNVWADTGRPIPPPQRHD